MATKLRPDVVLMDINMPDMDGIAATEQLSTQRTRDGRRHDVRPGRSRLPAAVDAGGRARVPRQAVQQRRADRIHPAGELARAGEGQPDRGRHADLHERDRTGRRRGRPGRGRLQPEGRRRSDDPRGQPGRRGGHGAWQAGRRHGRLVPVRRRRRPVQPQSQEQFDRRSASPSSSRARSTRSTRSSRSHSSGVRVLLAPPSPEMAETITTAGVKQVLEVLRHNYDLVIVDCTAFFNDTTLAILDAADIILTMLSLEITSIKNMRLFLEVAEQLGYEAGKVRLVLNRADSTLGIRVDGRREFDRSQGGRDDRERRPERGLRAQPGHPVLRLQSGGAGVAGHPSPRPLRRRPAGRRSSGSRRRRPGQAQAEEVPIRMAMIVVHSAPTGREGV